MAVRRTLPASGLDWETAQSMARGIWESLQQEPLIPFALIGGLLFAVYGFSKPDEVETIEITPQTRRALEDMEESLRGRPLTDEERQTLIDSHVEDEVLMREALRRGLEQKDSRVRRRLLTVMRSTLDEQVPEPTRAELQAYFRQNPERYAAQEVVTFDQVFFSFGNEPAARDALLEQLRGGADHRQLGEPRATGSALRKTTRREMLPTFGGEFTDRVFELTPNEWTGPLESAQGLHYVRVSERQSLPAPSFEQLEDSLRQDWMFKRRREIQSEKITEMRQRYRVVFREGQ